MSAAFELSPTTLEPRLLSSLVRFVSKAAEASPTTCAKIWDDTYLLYAPIRRWVVVVASADLCNVSND